MIAGKHISEASCVICGESASNQSVRTKTGFFPWRLNKGLFIIAVPKPGL